MDANGGVIDVVTRAASTGTVTSRHNRVILGMPIPKNVIDLSIEDLKSVYQDSIDELTQFGDDISSLQQDYRNGVELLDP